MFHKVVYQHMQGAVEYFLHPFNCKFIKQFSSDFLNNRLRFDRVMVNGHESVVPFLAHPVGKERSK